MHPTTPPLRRRLLASASLAGLLLLPLAPLARGQAATSSIRGQVVNTGTRSSLEGARIRVRETGKEYIAGEHGDYEITGLAPGTYTITLSYPGLDPSDHTVTLTAGQSLQQDLGLTSDVYVLKKLTVVTEREGNAAAIAAQRNAVNSQSVLSTDAFGNVAKGNLGNFLKRVPGVAGMSSGDGVDTDGIAIRGNTSDLVAIDVDGTRVASADAGSRSINVAALMTDMIERVEVVKSSTPDMDGDSFGGRVNLVTKSAYDTAGRRMTFRLADSYSVTYGEDLGYRKDNAYAPAFAAADSDVFSVFGGTRNLGIIVSGNWERVLDIRGTTAWNFGNATGGGGTTNGRDWSQFSNASTAMMEQVRGGATVKVDYKLSPSWSFGGSVRVGTFEDNMLRTRSAYAVGTVNQPLSNDPYFTVVDGARYVPEQHDRRISTNSVTWKFNGAYKPDKATQVTFDASYDRAIKHQDEDFIRLQSTQRFNYAMDKRDTWSTAPGDRFPDIHIIKWLYSGNTQPTASLPASYLEVNPFSDNLSSATSTSLYFRTENTLNERASYKADFKKTMPWRWPVEFKTGARYQTSITKRDRDELNGALPGPSSGSNFSGYLADDWRFGGGIGRYPVGFEPDIAKIKAAINPQLVGTDLDPRLNWTYNASTFTMSEGNVLSNSLFNDRKIWEDTLAAYLQASVPIGRLTALGGLRLEHTSVDRSVPVRNASFSSGLARYTLRRRDQTTYENYLPSLHFKYELTDNLALKASFSTNISRPNLNALLDNGEFNNLNRTIEVPNLDLKPKSSRTYDLSLEYYMGKVGSLTVSVFREEIKHYNTDVTFQISAQEAVELGADLSAADLALPEASRLPWTETTRDDSGNGWRHGLEIGYFQSFTSLPGAWRGFGAFANFTILRTQGNFQGRNLDTRINSKLTNSAPRTANAGVSYAYHRWDLRLQWNYLDAFLESLNTEDPVHRDKWRGARWQLDFNGRFKLTNRITLSCDLVNFTSNNGTKYRGTVDPERQEETNALGFLATAGLQVSF